MRVYLRLFAAVSLWLVLVAGFAPHLSAQETTGTITGEVTDETGAVLPGVTVLVKNVNTGRTWNFVSTETGTYTAGLLPPGQYEITFELQGFQPQVMRGIELHVNDRLNINGQLGAAGISETVEVTAASSFVQPTPQVQNLMGPQQVQELPLNNRNFVQLATLVPGVSSDLSDEVGIGLTSTVSLSINGARRNSVNWLVDGVSNVDVGSNITLLSTPTLESIQEFKIITSSYQAEWPRSGGGVVNVVTKSGSNQLSGSAYEFFRNDQLNANSFFRNLNSNPDISGRAPRLRYNNFGYTVGGPIKRNQLFFFWSEEWRRVTRAPASTTATVPLESWLTDPTSPNYVAPGARDPNALKLLALWPAPNQAGTQRYLTSTPSINNTRQEVLRVDYDINPNWRATGRYTHDLSETREPGGLFLGYAIPNVAMSDTNVPGNVLSTEVRTIMGMGLNEMKYQLSGNKITSESAEGTTSTRGQLGLQIPELFPENRRDKIPTVAVTGLSTYGVNQFYNIQYWNHTFTDNYTLQRENHTYKAGVLLTFEQKNENASNVTQGNFSFQAGGGRTAFQNFLTGNRDGLCGAACTYSEAEIDVTNNLRFNRYEAFVQDTWRVRSNVTVDYGVRYAYYPPVTDKNNMLTTFDPSAWDAAQAPTFATATGSAVVIGSGNPLNGIYVAGQSSPFGEAIYKSDKNNFQPRVGVSWDPRSDGQTIVRSAFGVYYDQPLVGIFEQNAFTNPPYVNTVSLQNVSLSNPGSGITPTTTGVRNLIASDPNLDTPRYVQWNVGLQRQLYRRGSIDVSYVGSRGDDLIQEVDINQPQPADVTATNGAINTVRPYRGFGSIRMRQTTAYSNYWGFLNSFRHEGGVAGTLTLNYTLSRNRTTSTNDRDAVDRPQNPLDLEAEYADARTDRRHIFSATYVYELPFFRDSTNQALKAALGGWQVSGIGNISSGPPVPFIEVNTNGSRRGNRADRVSDPKAGELDFPFWFDPTAFAPSVNGSYGNSQRAEFRLPGRHQWDITLSKNWYLVGDTRVQFRADFINAFNHTQWSTVDRQCTAANTVTLNRCDIGGTDTFGQITATRAPREIQLGLKIYW
jgi:hypothetical protein